jgi:FdhE protein
LVTESAPNKDRIEQAIAWARDDKPAYAQLYSLLEGLFILQAEVRETLKVAPPELDPVAVRTRLEACFPMLHRWELPLDLDAAEVILKGVENILPEDNALLRAAHRELEAALREVAGEREGFWRSFMHHEWEPWEEWVTTEEVDLASLIFLARSCIRPSLEKVAEALLDRFPVQKEWLRGYCPVCGSLPSLLILEGEGEQKAFCSWCASLWPVRRLQCPACDNQDHSSRGYLYVEAEPHYRVQYCEACGVYFKQIDMRERLYPPFLPLEELTTLHLDLLAQRAGWKQAPSPSPVVYGEGSRV